MLMQPEPTTRREERQDAQTQTVTPERPTRLTESTSDTRTLADAGFKAVFGARSAEALTAFNADVAKRGPDAALNQFAVGPGAYIPGTRPSPMSAAIADSLRMSVPGGDARTFTTPEVQTEPEVRTDSPTVDDPQEVRSVGGVTTETPFPKEVGPTETQESVLRRSYEEYAFKAGISNVRMMPDRELQPGEEILSPSELFVKERMMNNREESGGEYRIYNSDTEVAYTPDEWAARQEAGTITMYPTSGDIESLEMARQQTSMEQGARLAQEVLQLLDAGDELSAGRLLGFTRPDERLARAMEEVSRRQSDPDFQRGFVNDLRADGFIRLSQKYADNPVYSTMLTRSLSSAIAERDGVTIEPPADGSPSNIAVAIARRADSETLARLVANPNHSLGTEFLVEAAKSVTVGEKRDFGAGREDVLTRAAQDPQAALQLLQDPNFVREAAKRLVGSSHSPDPNHAVLSRFVESGLSAEMQASNPEQFAKALSTVIEVVTKPGGIPIPGTVGSQPQQSYPIMNGNLADALTRAYVANPRAFTEASGLTGGRAGQLDGQDVRAFMVAIKPFADRRNPQSGQTIDDQILAATAVEYVRLLDRAVATGRDVDAAAVGNFAGAILDGTSQANTAAARAADARREKLNQYILIAAGIATGGAAKGVGGTVADVLSKATTTELGSGLKSNNAAQADAQNRGAYFGQFSTNKVAALGAVERASTGDRASRTAEQRVADAQFVRNLRTYNDALPPGEKILDGNGRLIPSGDATPAQLSNMERLVNGDVPVGSTRPEVTRAVGEVSDGLHRLVTNINGTTDQQILQ